ncbi:SGNH/GDSL hydrolase family protein [Actinomycetospora sp. NBRC 106378]|uniref:SGNH/GDSL hydrolase family protein n=1 Tax=Actinomycetospora sp. NBRC 106378 TaxID=3032208 RepID=UPI0024A0ABC7|nr:SGNH/GDSL hydrolase family protein [Actinomycetospora sp. NBRC 106378]GLZ51764.1 hypothetical protein Acsp07_13810 [Actinomycetospora sp. NBRC 106378]
MVGIPRRRVLALGALGAAGAFAAACSSPPPADRPAWASGVHAWDPARSLYHPDAPWPRWTAARTAGRGHVTTMLDSITHGAGVPGLSRPCQQYSWPGRLRRILDGRFGPSGTGVAVPWNGLLPTDPRFQVFGPVGEAPLGMHACACLRIPGAPDDGAAVEFTGDGDTFRVHHLGPGIRFAVDGVPVLPSSQVGSTHVVSTVPAGQYGTHVLRVLSPGREPTSTASLLGVEAGTATGMRVSNLARAGLSAGSLVADDAGGLRGLAVSVDAMAADLAILLVSANDFRAHVPVATFVERIRTTIRRQRATGGDVLLATPGEPDPGIFPPDHVLDPPLTDYLAALYGLADAEDVPLLDLRARWGAHADAAARGFFTDGIHPNDRGSEDIAQAVAAVLL